ncbi:MAG: lipoprotein, partial [Paludibacteraceae bacterium]
MKKTILLLFAAVVVAGCGRTSEPTATDYLAKTVRVAQS